MNELPKRKPYRLQNVDYSQNGTYFITVCIKGRHEILGNIPVGATVPGRPFPASDHPFQTVPRMELSEIGKIVDDAIKYYKENLAGVVFDRYVIMPNHIHAIIVIRSETGDRGENNTGDRGRSPLQNRMSQRRQVFLPGNVLFTTISSATKPIITVLLSTLRITLQIGKKIVFLLCQNDINPAESYK